MSIRLAFVDDYDISQKVFAGLFAQIPDVEVVAVCGSGEHLLSQLEELEIDVAVVDLIMPVMNGVETIAAIKKIHPAIHCIGISSYDHEEILLQMVESGARGYLSKEVNMHEYQKAITEVMKGNTHFPETLQALLRNREA
jgi:DNA-binding NarL/FixJ family response regulator